MSLPGRVRARPAWGVLAAFVLLANGGSATADASAKLMIVLDRELPRAIEWAFDLRWLDDETLAIAAGRAGVYELSIVSSDAPARQDPDSARLKYAARVAVSTDHLLAAAPFGVLGWRSRRPSGASWQEDKPMAAIVDLDVSDGRVVLLGARRVRQSGDRQPRWAPEGGILFTSDLAGNLGEPRLLLTARSGRDGRAREMAQCAIVDPGAVRFLPPDARGTVRYVVVPGVQPGVLLYAADGRLLKAWDSAPVGFYDSCDIDADEVDRLSVEVSERIAWWQRHTLLDEIVPWESWFALILREPTAGGAGWQLVPFDADGPGAAIELPVQAGAPGIRLRGDFRGNRLALLLFDSRDVGGAPSRRPRIVILERQRGAE